MSKSILLGLGIAQESPSPSFIPWNTQSLLQAAQAVEICLELLFMLCLQIRKSKCAARSHQWEE